MSPALILIGCAPDPGPLPEATQEGANTYGCYVDGQPWKPHDRDFKSSHLNFVYGSHKGVYIYALRSDIKGDSIQRVIILNFSTVRQPFVGTVVTDSINLCRYMTGGDGYGLHIPTTWCEIDDQCQGRVTFTRFDPETKVVTGTFSFEAYSEKTNRVVKITDGRFDGIYVERHFYFFGF